MENRVDMLVVQIGPYPLSSDRVAGGIEASVYGLSQEQSRTMEVHVFDLPRQDHEEAIEKDGEVVIHRFRNVGNRQASASRRVRFMAKEIIALMPDVCHIHGTGLFSLMMYKRLKREGLKVIVTVHGLVGVEKRKMLKKGATPKRILQFVYQRKAENRLLSQIPVAIVDTEYVREMVSAYPIRRVPRMYVIPQGINEDYYSLDCSSQSQVFLSVGAIGERKGHLLTLKAFERVRESGMDAKLTMVGTIADASYYEQLRVSVQNSSYKEDVSLFVDLSEEELKEQYSKAHVFVLHSEEESQGIVFTEAMATGMPVVATRVGGVPYVVKDGVTGLLSGYGDVDSYAKNMQTLLGDANLWLALSRQAKVEAESYHWSSVANKVLELYKIIMCENC